MDTSKLTAYDTGSYLRFSNPALIHKDLEMLTGILKGIAGDHQINVKEHEGLLLWLHKTTQYENKEPYQEVIGLLKEAIADNILTEDECDEIIWFCQKYTTGNKYYDDLTAGVQRLHGVVKGISIDGVINEKEISFLDAWLDDNEYLKNTWPYDELYNLTTRILRDKVITSEEHNEILSFCKALSADKASSNNKDLSILSGGFYQIDPEIVFQDQSFCITGVSKKYKRKEIADRIELYGGAIQNGVSSRLNYLVVCDEKNTCWAFTCYGRKIEQAMYYRQNGAKLIVVHEYDLFDAFESVL